MAFTFNPFTGNFDAIPAASKASGKVFYVSQDTGSDTNPGTFNFPYKTIQTAITAAELIASYFNQVLIKVYPSTGNGYVENLTFSQQGVVLESASPLRRSDAAAIRGNITVNLTGTAGGTNYNAASNQIYIKGFVLTCTSGNTITFSGSTFQRLFLTETYVDNTGTGSAVVLTNTGVNGVKSTLTIFNSDINNSSASSATIKVSAGRLFTSGTQYDINNSNASGTAILVDGASAAGPTLTCDKASLTGGLTVSDNTATVILTFCGISSGSAAAIITPSSASTGTIFLGQVGLTTTATNSITGSGVVILSAVARFSTGGDIVSTVTQAAISGFPQGALQIGTGATTVTNALLTIKNGHITSQQTTAPTSALQTGAGTTASKTLTRCTDTAGGISITTAGSGIAAGAQLIVTFNKAYATAPVVTLTPSNANAAALVQAYVTSSTSTFTINFGVAGVTGTAYTFFYHVIET